MITLADPLPDDLETAHQLIRELLETLAQRVRSVNCIFPAGRRRGMMCGAPSGSDRNTQVSHGLGRGGQRDNAGLKPRSSVRGQAAGLGPPGAAHPPPRSGAGIPRSHSGLTCPGPYRPGRQDRPLGDARGGGRHPGHRGGTRNDRSTRGRPPSRTPRPGGIGPGGRPGCEDPPQDRSVPRVRDVLERSAGSRRRNSPSRPRCRALRRLIGAISEVLFASEDRRRARGRAGVESATRAPAVITSTTV